MSERKAMDIYQLERQRDPQLLVTLIHWLHVHKTPVGDSAYNIGYMSGFLSKVWTPAVSQGDGFFGSGSLMSGLPFRYELTDKGRIFAISLSTEWN